MWAIFYSMNLTLDYYEVPFITLYWASDRVREKKMKIMRDFGGKLCGILQCFCINKTNRLDRCVVKTSFVFFFSYTIVLFLIVQKNPCG